MARAGVLPAAASDALPRGRRLEAAGTTRCQSSSAVTAVAVESALLDSSPSQWPCGPRSASNAARAFPKARSSRARSMREGGFWLVEQSLATRAR